MTYKILLMRERDDKSSAKRCKYGMIPRLGYVARRKCDCDTPCEDQEACERRRALFEIQLRKDH